MIGAFYCTACHYLSTSWRHFGESASKRKIYKPWPYFILLEHWTLSGSSWSEITLEDSSQCNNWALLSAMTNYCAGIYFSHCPSQMQIVDFFQKKCPGRDPSPASELIYQSPGYFPPQWAGAGAAISGRHCLSEVF